MPYAVIAYNNSVNQTHEFAPYEHVFGHISNWPPETLFDEHVLGARPNFTMGDKVCVKESQIQNKLHGKFNGPFEILDIFKILLFWLSLKPTKEQK